MKWDAQTNESYNQKAILPQLNSEFLKGPIKKFKIKRSVLLKQLIENIHDDQKLKTFLENNNYGEQYIANIS